MIGIQGMPHAEEETDSEDGKLWYLCHAGAGFVLTRP